LVDEKEAFEQQRHARSSSSTSSLSTVLDNPVLSKAVEEKIDFEEKVEKEAAAPEPEEIKHSGGTNIF